MKSELVLRHMFAHVRMSNISSLITFTGDFFINLGIKWSYTAWPQNGSHFHALTSSNIDRFSNLFHCQNQENIYNNIVTELKCSL